MDPVPINRQRIIVRSSKDEYLSRPDPGTTFNITSFAVLKRSSLEYAHVPEKNRKGGAISFPKRGRYSVRRLIRIYYGYVILRGQRI